MGTNRMPRGRTINVRNDDWAVRLTNACAPTLATMNGLAAAAIRDSLGADLLHRSEDCDFPTEPH
jgi:hypothetical protein